MVIKEDSISTILKIVERWLRGECFSDFLQWRDGDNWVDVKNTYLPEFKNWIDSSGNVALRMKPSEIDLSYTNIKEEIYKWDGGEYNKGFSKFMETYEITYMIECVFKDVRENIEDLKRIKPSSIIFSFGGYIIDFSREEIDDRFIYDVEAEEFSNIEDMIRHFNVYNKTDKFKSSLKNNFKLV